MDDDEPPDYKRESLEEMIRIEIEKYQEPIITPSMCRDGVTSIRNPGGVKYRGKYLLLCTVRSRDDISRLHLARSGDGKHFEVDKSPFINTDKDSRMGVEDARIVGIGEEYYITFTSFKGVEGENKVNTTRIGIVKTKDFEGYYDRKIILDEYANNKNCVIFQKDSSSFYVIHRPFNGAREERPEARLMLTRDFEEFQDLGVFLSPRIGMWDGARVGINTAPIKIKEGLLFFYHGADEKTNVYSIGAVLKKFEDPQKTLKRSLKPLIVPELPWETGEYEGGAESPMVVFGQAIIPSGKNEWDFFYGGGDRYIGKARVRIN